MTFQFRNAFYGVTLMREIALFVEDYAHQQVIGTLVRRIAEEQNISVRLDWRNAVGGYPQVAGKLADYLRDLNRQGGSPDLIIVATDSNCVGLNQRARQLERSDSPAQMILAIPDPHIERWLLLDGTAFRDVVGRGCDAPDQNANANATSICLSTPFSTQALFQVSAASSSPKT